MRTRLLLAAICILALPLAISLFTGDKVTNIPFAMIAHAGHTTAGSWCECGAPGCICDPGEERTGHGASQGIDQNKKPVDQGVSPIGTQPGFDFGTGALILALALIVWTRLRV